MSRKFIDDSKMAFRLEMNEIDEAETDLQFEVHCNLPFMEMALVRGILQAIELVNKANAVKVKNGFWLIIQDRVNEKLKAKEEKIDE